MAYTKYHDPWGAGDPLSGEAFNHIEGQWDEIQAEADAHSHDSRYYTESLSDATFFSASFYTGFDADLLDGYHYADLVSEVLPVGCIMIWSGTEGTIPDGWHVCDGGTYGGRVSPDLRDRFVVGAGDAYVAGATGGPASWNSPLIPTGTVTIGDHILTTSELPAHTHPYIEKYNPKILDLYSGNVHYSAVGSRSVAIGQQATGDEAHGHTGSTISFESIDSRPAYYSLFYIMKYV